MLAMAQKRPPSSEKSIFNVNEERQRLHNPNNSDKKMKKKAKKKIIKDERVPQEQDNQLVELDVKKRDSFGFSDDDGEGGSINNGSVAQSSSSSEKPHWSLMMAQDSKQGFAPNGTPFIKRQSIASKRQSE